MSIIALHRTISMSIIALHIAILLRDIVANFRIPAKNGRPYPLVVRLCSKDIRNCWINGKIFIGALDGSAVFALLAG